MIDLVFVLVAFVLIAGGLVYAGSTSAYGQIGRGGLELEHPSPDPSADQRNDEIMQLLQARSDRLERRGEAPLDVETEFNRLSRTKHLAPGMLEEIRHHVEATNERRIRRGDAPLDAEAEVQRLLREAG